MDLLETDTESSVRRQCFECGKYSPPAQTSYTLISASHGWRLAREVGPAGRPRMVWRCPQCWQEHKERKRRESGAP